MKHIVLSSFLIFSLNAQDLKTSIEELLDTDPMIQERLSNFNATKEDVLISKSEFYPKLDLSMGIGHERTNKSGLKNAITDTTTNLNVYQNSLKLTLNLFNGFQSTQQLKQQKQKRISAAYSYIEKVNEISFSMTQSYIELLKNKELFDNTNENIQINKDILQRVAKLYDSGLTTLSEVNKIESSLALAQANGVVQENSYLDAKYSFEKILGRYIDVDTMISPDINITLPQTMSQAIEYAIHNNPSIVVTNYNIKIARYAHKEKKSSFYPSIDFELSESINKNQSATEGQIATTRAMLYLKYNLFNGYADEAKLQKTVSQLHQEVQSKSQLRKKLIQELSLAWIANEKLSEQLQHLKKYLGFSKKTLTLYSKEYDLGRRSLLDLLSAQNDFIGAKSQIITAKYNVLFAKYRILNAMGTLVASVTNMDKDAYANVNLDNKHNDHKDLFLINLDKDNDLITDDYDICNNSKITNIKNVYGCQYLDDNLEENISTIERYNGFTFEDKDTIITPKVKLRMKSLIHQLKSYGFDNLKIEIFANAIYDDIDKNVLINLSRKRANIFRDMLILEGFSLHNIYIHQNGDSAPIIIGNEKLNNRIDIVVKKFKN